MSVRSALLRLRNTIDYPLRQFFHWRRVGFRLPPARPGGLYAHLSGGERDRAEAGAARLSAQYHLEGLAQDSAPVNYRENLFYLNMLEQALDRAETGLPDEISVADIGPSHWFYVQALYALLRWWRNPVGRAVELTGYEIDAFRVYNDLYSRYDHAQAHIRGLPGVTYLPQGFSAQPGRFDLVTLLFPFVFSRDHLEWGLPDRLFEPAELRASAWASLKPGGVLIIINQGEAEHLAERKNLEALGIPVAAAYRQDPLLFSYPLERYVLVACHGR